MAFVDFISEQPGGFSRFPLQMGGDLVPRHPGNMSLPPRPSSLPPSPQQLTSAIAPPQAPAMFQIRPPAFCPRCYSHFNANFALGGLCPNCSCSIPQLTIRPPPSAVTVPRPVTAPIMHLGPPQHMSKQGDASLQPRPQLQNHVHHSELDDATVDRFSMTNMLHVIDDVLKEQDEKSLVSQSSAVLSSVDLAPQVGNTMVGVSFQNNFRSVNAAGREQKPMAVVSEATRQATPYNKLCKCGNEHIVYCSGCYDYLCEDCILNHEKDSALKDHVILDPLKIFVSTSLGMPPPAIGSVFITPSPKDDIVPVIDENTLKTCSQHKTEKLSLFCHTCIKMACKSCVMADHVCHTYMSLKEAYLSYKPTVGDLVSKAQVEINLLDLSLAGAEKMSASVIVKHKEAVQSVKEIFQEYREALATQEQEVISQVNSIANIRTVSLTKEISSIENLLSHLKSASQQAEEALERNSQGDLLVTHFSLTDSLRKCRSQLVSRNPCEDDSFVLKTNKSVAETALKNICMFTTAPYPPLCTAMGEGLYHPRLSRLCTVILCTKDRSGENCLKGGERLFVQLKSTPSGGATLSVDIRDNSDGSYSINFRPRVKGEHQLVIAIRGQHIQGSPFTLTVDGGREYGRFGVVTHVFGSEGIKKGQFCRPWGICCDHHGNLIIGDRSNHRIQVFDSTGILKFQFGSEGNRSGQFNRPAGVAVTREGNIVVADKDNHRIQVLKCDGSFLFMFGSKGGNDGQMIYPYDVAVNQVDGRIAVTDTGNHRLLIFNYNGILLGKFGYKGYLCGHFDSPRGIAFNDDGHIIVSDFNVHHVLVIHPDGTTARILGSQGSGNGQFMRPQGIAVDHMGNYIVTDTRNNRIVIMHPSGHFIAKFGVPGQAPGQFDRPTSVAVMPDGRIAVVDFGNSRVQIF